MSASESVDMIKQARKSGLNVTASTPAQNLFFSDEDLTGFNTNLKVLPPFREAADQRDLIKGIQRGHISCIVSNHEPYEEERKKLEFANAAFGSTGLQTAFGLANTAGKEKLEIDQIISCLTTGPRTVLGLEHPEIYKGNKAELTLFDADLQWTLKTDSLASKSKNSAAIGIPMTGKSLGIVNKGRLYRGRAV